MHGQSEELSENNTDSKSMPSYDLQYVKPKEADGWEEPPEARETHEVFQATSEGVNFRTVSWQRATVLFLKIQFAMSILAVPSSLGALGAVGGALSLVGWQALNTYTAIVLGEFHNRHPECHTLADMCSLPLGKFGRELLGIMILVAQVLIVAAGLVSISTALNALSNHSACTVVFTLVAAILVTAISSIRTFSKLGWLTWFGFVTFVVAVLIFTIAVTQQDRPAAAPQTGDFELGYTAIAYPSFAVGMTATLNIFISGSGSSMYLPIISEMRRPKDYPKAALVAGVLVGALYLSLSLVIYRYCGQWLSSPAFGSAGPLFKKISYGVALPGLVIGIGIYSHVAAKYLFVRVLRDSRHLQANTATHWAIWLGINIVLGTLAFIVAEAVPILNYLLALAASLCFAPFSLIFPAILWLYEFAYFKQGSLKQKVIYAGHVLILLIGAFLAIGGTYGAAISIRDAFASGAIGGVFQCADNSGSSN